MLTEVFMYTGLPLTCVWTTSKKNQNFLKYIYNYISKIDIFVQVENSLFDLSYPATLVAGQIGFSLFEVNIR